LKIQIVHLPGQHVNTARYSVKSIVNPSVELRPQAVLTLTLLIQAANLKT